MTSGQRPNAPLRTHTATRDHAPAQPSGLRQSYTRTSNESPPSSPASSPGPRSPRSPRSPGIEGSAAGPSAPYRPAGTETSPLLRVFPDTREHAHDGPCNHGTFSPRPPSLATERSYTPSMTDTESDVGNVPIIDGLMNKISGKKNWRRKWMQRMRSKKMSTSSALAQRYGVRADAFM